MKQLRILSMAFMAMFALAGIMSASASAEATLPSILPLGEAANPLTGTAKTGESKFGTGVLSVTSKEASGTFTGNAPKLGAFKELYKSVRGPFGESCLGEGDEKGTVESTGTYHIRDYKNAASELKVALIFLVKELKFSCEATKVAVKGCVAGALSPENKLASSLTLTLSEGKTAGDESIITVLNEANTATENCELLSSTNGGAFALSAQTQTTTLSGFKKAKAATEVLVMPL
jgi:hypothetical protein